MTESPTISVLMPVYNAERYVAKAVQSILDQTFRDFEFLIIDDGSTDGSRKILESFARRDSRIHLISRANTGLVVALNEMLDLARGEFIARMDADDISLPARLETQLAYMRAHPETGFIGSWIRLIDEKGRFLTVFELPVEHSQIDAGLLSGNVTLSHPTCFWRRALLANFRYEPKFKHAEDIDFFLRLAEHVQIANLGEPMLEYRHHSTSVSRAFTDVQKVSHVSAIKAACGRRGIAFEEGTALVSSGEGNGDRYRRFAWFAFNSRELGLSAEYALRSLLCGPFSLQTWKLLAVLLRRSVRGT